MPARRIVIFGQAKSGTTALFYALKPALPRRTRLLFEPTFYRPLRDDSKRGVLAKLLLDHESELYRDFLGFERKLFVVRDPRDWLVSGTLFLVQQLSPRSNDPRALATVLQLLHEKEQRPGSVSLTAVLERILALDPDGSLEKTIAWMRGQLDWLCRFPNGIGDHFALRYEQFVTGNLGELESYLGLSLQRDVAVAPDHRHVVRTRGSGDWRNWFVQEDVAAFRPIFDEYLRRYEYPIDWQLSPHPVILPQYCSRYVEYTLKKRAEEMSLPRWLNRLRRIGMRLREGRILS